MGGCGPGCPLSKACCLTPQAHAWSIGEFSSESLTCCREVETRSLRIKGGLPSPVASWLNRTMGAKRHCSLAASNPLPPCYETGIIPLDHGGTEYRRLNSTCICANATWHVHDQKVQKVLGYDPGPVLEDYILHVFVLM